MEQARAGDVASAAGLHRGCFACGLREDGLGLTFRRSGDDAVSAEWTCMEKYRSYPGIAHGGIVATILDSAMTNCLLVRGTPAVTAEMHVQYISPLRVDETVTVSASLVRSRSPIFILEARIVHDGQVIAMATGKFMRVEIWSHT
jgi:uncharacterized protein (TIGR00369 family)